MKSFKQFIHQSIIEQSIQYTQHKLNLQEIYNFLQNNCKDSLWMIENNTPLYRGKREPFTNFKSGIIVGDSTHSKRKSANTMNYYTLILDNHPEMKNWPKRSKSFICSASFEDAANYSRDLLPYAIIPIDGAKIGAVNNNDIWLTQILLFDSTNEIIEHNSIFKKMQMSDEDWNYWLNFDKELKESTDYNFEYQSPLSLFSDAVGIDIAKKYKNIFLEEIYRAYSPEETKFTHYTTKTLPESNISGEIWVEGKCVFITTSDWFKIVQGLFD